MQAINRRLTELIDGNKQFIIPVFQRDYSWTREQCRQLWDAVMSASDGAEQGGHFMGSIVYVAAATFNAAFQNWLVIDGQQRLTTLTLLLTALRDRIAETNWYGGDDSPTPVQIDAYFLKNTLQSGHRRYKLSLRRADHATLQALLDRGDVAELGTQASELVLDAYNYFRDRLQAPDTDLDCLYRGIGRLTVVDVTLDRQYDNPQLVFESMNSTGIDLSQGDLVRNYLLMRVEEPQQTTLYEDHWSAIEACFSRLTQHIRRLPTGLHGAQKAVYPSD